MLDLMSEFTEKPEVQGFDPDNPQPGFYLDVDNDIYHSATKAISNSILGMCHESVSRYPWVQTCPVDTSKLETFDFGSAVHCLVLEPERFKEEYAIMPQFNLRTNAGKEKRDSWLAYHSNKYHLTAEEYAKAELMKASLMSDPRFSAYINDARGVAESVIVWRDEETGLLLRIRPDWLVELDDMVICLDLKTTESLTKFRRDFYSLRYDIQDCMYRDGIEKHFGKPVLFLFGAVSKTIELGRYPVLVDHVEQVDRDLSYSIYRSDLNKVAQAIKSDNWIEYGTIRRTNKQREYLYEQQQSA